MNKKTLRRVLCFLLAFVVFISMPLDLHAEAVAIEFGWMTWVLISAMTAMGFSFAVSGGIDALQSAVEDAVDEYDEYREVIGFNNGLFELLDDKLLFGGSGGPNPNQGPNLGNRFWLTAGGVAAVAEFVQWVRENKWFAGEELNNNTQIRYIKMYVNGEMTKFYQTYISNSPVTNSNLYDVIYSGSVLNKGDTFNFYRGNTYFARISDNWDNLNVNNYVSVNCLDIISPYGYTVDQVVGICLVYNNSSYRFAYLLNDGNCVPYGGFTPYYGEGLDNISSIISSPSEVTEFDVQQNELLELDFSAFENQEFNSPEEMADAIKNKIVETGTVPNVKPEVVVDPSTLPQPTPVPTPVPSPEIEDIDDLGLPTLGEAIFNKFPFSLPKDLKRIADILNAEPVTPFWEVNLFETLGNRVPFVDDTTIRIDLAEYEALGQISRWASVITFVIFLVIITKGVIRW